MILIHSNAFGRSHGRKERVVYLLLSESSEGVEHLWRNKALLVFIAILNNFTVKLKPVSRSKN